MTKLSDFLDKAHIKHGDKYDYSLVEYINSKTKIKIICREIGHGEFFQTPVMHICGNGCPQCGRKKTEDTRRTTVEKFKKRGTELNGDHYDYSLVTDIKNNTSKVKIICKIDNHGLFEQTVSMHLNGKNGCPKCAKVIIGNKKRKPYDKFINECREIHENEYDYSKVIYTNKVTRIEIICRTHGSFWQQPYDHLSGCGCPKCRCNSVSKAETKWLDSLNNPNIERQKRIYLNEKEYIKADGYNSETNTVYEYHGKFFHGHPDRGNAEDKHPYGGTYGERYQATLLKEQRIKDAGYNLVSIWGP
jgi:hypothetical protein